MPSPRIPSELTAGMTPALAKRVFELEKQKLVAVEAEDYALAFKLKNKISVPPGCLTMPECACSSALSARSL